MFNPLAGAPTRFAHLLRGTSPAALAAAAAPTSAGARAEDDDEDEAKKKADEEAAAKKAEEEAAAEKAADEKETARRAKNKAAGRDDDDDGEDGDEDDGDDDGDRREMRAKSTARAARLHERGRCAAIFTDKAAAANPALAAELAFATDLPRQQAVAVLRAGGTPAGTRLADRMATVPAARVGPDGGDAGAATPAALGARIVAAYETARGIKK